MLQGCRNSLPLLLHLQPLQGTQCLHQHQHHCSMELVQHHPNPRWCLQRGFQEDSLLQMALLAAFLPGLLLHAPWWNHCPLWRMHLCYCLSSWWYLWHCNLLNFVGGIVGLLLVFVTGAPVYRSCWYSFCTLELIRESGKLWDFGFPLTLSHILFGALLNYRVYLLSVILGIIYCQSV